MTDSRFEFTSETLEWCLARVDRYADALQHCREADGRAQPSYNLTADALEWPDDYPPQVPNDIDFHQWYAALLNARTSIILGLSESNCEEFLHTIKVRVPTWPGNAPDRRSKDLREQFNTLRIQELGRVEGTLDGLK